MALRNDDQEIVGLYHNGTPIRNVYYNGQTIWTRGGVPEISSFTATPANALRTSVRRNITLRFAVTGSTTNTITETLSDGTIRNVPVSGNSVVIPMPRLTARYTLVSRNVNGTASRQITFYRGVAPVIATWRWGGFRQAIGAIAPASVLLEWNVTGSPNPRLEITPNIHFHPSELQGSYRLTRVGAATTQTLTLTATNVFGTVNRDLTINWPPFRGG